MTLYDIAGHDNDKTSLDPSVLVGMFTDGAMEEPQATWTETRRMRIDDAPEP